MYRCIICRYEVPLDDAVAPTESGKAICLRCYTRETATTLQMPRMLRYQVESTLLDIRA